MGGQIRQNSDGRVPVATRRKAEPARRSALGQPAGVGDSARPSRYRAIARRVRAVGRAPWILTSVITRAYSADLRIRALPCPREGLRPPDSGYSLSQFR